MGMQQGQQTHGLEKVPFFLDAFILLDPAGDAGAA